MKMESDTLCTYFRRFFPLLVKKKVGRWLDSYVVDLILHHACYARAPTFELWKDWCYSWAKHRYLSRCMGCFRRQQWQRNYDYYLCRGCDSVVFPVTFLLFCAKCDNPETCLWCQAGRLE